MSRGGVDSSDSSLPVDTESGGSVDSSDSSLPVDTESDGGLPDTGSGEDLMVAGDGGAVSPAPCSLRTSGDLLFDLVLSTSVDQVELSADRFFLHDFDRWALWDRSTLALIAQGDRPCVYTASSGENSDCVAPQRPRLRGNVLLVGARAGGFELRNATDGSLITMLNPPGRLSEFGVSTDGAYVWATTSTGLHTWDANGNALTSHAGDYEQARVWAAPDDLRVKSRNFRGQTIERISPLTGTHTTTNGGFGTWFADGKRYLIQSAVGVGVYSAEGELEATGIHPDVLDYETTACAGYGDYFWCLGIDSTRLFKVGGGSAPIRSFAGYVEVHLDPFPFRAPDGILVATGTDRQKQIIDLRGPTPKNVPGLLAEGLTPIAVGADLFTLYTGASGLYAKRPSDVGPVRFTCGSISKVIPTRNHVWAFATSSRTAVVSDLKTRTTLRVFELENDPSQLELSADGRELSDGHFVYDVASGDHRPGSFPKPAPPPGWPVVVSPSGTRMAVGDALYENDLRVGAIAGEPIVWLDDDRLLIKPLVRDLGPTIVDVKGAFLANSGIPISSFMYFDPALDPLEGGRLLHMSRSADKLANNVRDVATGEVVWESSTQTRGGRANDYYIVSWRDSAALLTVRHP